MKTSKLLLLGMLVSSLCLVSSVSAICTLNDGIDTEFSSYEVDDEVCVTISLRAEDCGGNVTDVYLYYYAPDDPPSTTENPCGSSNPGILIDGPITLVDNAAATIYDCDTTPAIPKHTVTEADLAAGSLRVWYRVLFTKPDEDPSCDGDNASATVTPPEPCLEITKTVDCEVSKVGDDVVYTICIDNCGDTDIYFGPEDILDTVLGDISEAFAFPNEWPDGDCPEITEPGLIPAGAVCCLDFPYTIQEGDDTGEPGAILTNQVSFEGEDEYEQDVSEVSNDVDILLLHPDWTLTKDCRTDPLEVDDTAIFDVYAENTGDVCLHFDLTELSLPLIFDLAPGETYEAETNILVETEEDVTNTIVGTVTLLYGPDETCGEPDVCLPNEYEVEASDTCEVGGGATRTPGYWKTHSYMAECMFDECYPDGIDFGWTYVEDIADLMAIFHAKKAKLNKICQARLQLSFHMGAAILNDCLPNGLPFSSTGETFAGLATIMADCDVAAITEKIGIVGGYNEEGDDVEIIWPGGLCDDLPAYNATPAVSKEWASTVDMDDLMEDCQDCMDEKVTGKGKNK